MRKTSHHPRLIHKEEKEEKDDSDDKQFSVHEKCLSDRADVILPYLPEPLTGTGIETTSVLLVTKTALSWIVCIPKFLSQAPFRVSG